MYSTCILSHFAGLEKAKHPQTWMGDRVFIVTSLGRKISSFLKKSKFSIADRLLHFIKVQTIWVFAQMVT